CQVLECRIDKLNLSCGICNENRIMAVVHRAPQVQQCLSCLVWSKIVASLLSRCRHIFELPPVTSDIVCSSFRRSSRPVPLVTTVLAQFGNALFRMTHL